MPLLRIGPVVIALVFEDEPTIEIDEIGTRDEPSVATEDVDVRLESGESALHQKEPQPRLHRGLGAAVEKGEGKPGSRPSPATWVPFDQLPDRTACVVTPPANKDVPGSDQFGETQDTGEIRPRALNRRDRHSVDLGTISWCEMHPVSTDARGIDGSPLPRGADVQFRPDVPGRNGQPVEHGRRDVGVERIARQSQTKVAATVLHGLSSPRGSDPPVRRAEIARTQPAA